MVTLLLVLLVTLVQDLHGQRLLFGSGISSCNPNDLSDQICPTYGNNDYKYARIKTYNGKYLWAQPTTSTDSKYVRTRCCGVKDVVGREDIKVPTLRSTFKVHCNQRVAEIRPVVLFEVLKDETNDENKIEPSGYFLYARSESTRPLQVVKNPKFNWAGVNFVLDRWKAGTQTGIMTLGRKTWLGSYDDGDGYINVHSYPTSQYPFPNVQLRFTIEILSKECVETNLNKVMPAAPKNTNAEDCESLPDRCFVSLGWDYRRREMKKGFCYYKKGSRCYKHWVGQSGSYEDTTFTNARDCESRFGMCWNYLANVCYLGADYDVLTAST